MNSKCKCYKNVKHIPYIPNPDAWEGQFRARTEFAGDQLVLFHFVCRWTCSRCWKRALALRRSLNCLKNQDIAMVMVGPSRQIKQANRFAMGLRLPVTLLADDWHSLSRAYALSNQDEYQHGESLVLVDRYGMVRFRENKPDTGSILRLVDFVKSLDGLIINQSGNTATDTYFDKRQVM